MSHCACSFLRGLWSFLMGSLRLILFFSNIILLVVTTLITMVLFQFSRNGTIDLLPKTFLQLEIVALSAFSMLIAIIAVYGSFYRHKTTLKVFMALSTLNVIFVMALIIGASSGGSLERENEKYIDELKSYQPFYDWSTSKPTDLTVSETTRVWDSLQSSFCCGIEGPSDWDIYRPKALPPGSFPRSCCAPDERFVPLVEGKQNKGEPLCQEGVNLYRVGCRERIVKFERLLLGYGLFLVAVQLILAVISCCVCHHVGADDTPLIGGGGSSVQINSGNKPAIYPDPYRY